MAHLNNSTAADGNNDTAPSQGATTHHIIAKRLAAAAVDGAPKGIWRHGIGGRQTSVFFVNSFNLKGWNVGIGGVVITGRRWRMLTAKCSSGWPSFGPSERLSERPERWKGHVYKRPGREEVGRWLCG
jgi:hypothetical protein